MKFGDLFSPFLTKLELKAKASICSAIKIFSPSYSRKLSVISYPFHKETFLVIEIFNFKIESLIFQNSHLNRTYSISDIKLPFYK